VRMGIASCLSQLGQGLETGSGDWGTGLGLWVGNSWRVMADGVMADGTLVILKSHASIAISHESAMR